MNNQAYFGNFMNLYFVILPLFFAMLLLIGLFLEVRTEYKKRKKLKGYYQDENH